MRILLVCPAPAGTRHGNRVTALRWARILRSLGHRVTIARSFAGTNHDLLIALHARKSAVAIEGFRRAFPKRPIIVALTGTDAYRDVHRNRRARTVLEHARRIVALQPLAIRELPRRLRRRARVVHQSALPGPPRRKSERAFDVSVIGHLRTEKDPFRAAMAARWLPPSSRIRIVHVGKAMNAGMARRARAEMARNPRYRWLGERSGARTRAILAGSRLMVISSRMEGGANVVSEALAAAVPILASRIPGNVGLLGPGYPGLFPPGNERRLAALLRRAETDRRYLARLAALCARRAVVVSPRREREAWRFLLDRLARETRSRKGARAATFSRPR